MGKKKTVMQRLAALLAASMVLTSSAFTSLAAVGSNVAADAEVKVKMELSSEAEEMEVGDELDLKLVFDATTSDAEGYDATASNADAKAENLVWSTSDDEVVSITEKADDKTVCTVKALAEGEATVTVTLRKGSANATAKCVVTVTKKDTDEPGIDEPSKPIESTATPSNMDDVPEEFHKDVVEQMRAIDEEMAGLSDTVLGDVKTIRGLASALPDGVTDVTLKLEKAEATQTRVELIEEDGKVIDVKVIVEQVRYDIKLINNENNEEVKLNGKVTVSVPVTLPTALADDANIAKVRHGLEVDENGVAAKWENLVNSNITREADKAPAAVIRTKSFSPFELTFEHQTTPPRRGGGSGSSSSGSSRNTSASGTWQQDANGWWFQYTNGGYAANKWELINGKWYYFNENGYAVTGWQLINGQWYYLDLVNCDMQTGWHLDSVDGKWYYLTASGAMATGWVEVGGKSYYLSQTAGEATYTYDAVNGAWVYTNAEARPFGSMYASETTPDGYQVDADGAWIQ